MMAWLEWWPWSYGEVEKTQERSKDLTYCDGAVDLFLAKSLSLPKTKQNERQLHNTLQWANRKLGDAKEN